MTTTEAPRPALTFDEILDQGSPRTELVPLCMNGRIRAQYEAVLERIAVRDAEREAARRVASLLADQAAQKAAEADGADNRLGVAAPAADTTAGDEDQGAGYRDPEQDTADRLLAEMKRFTVVFELSAVGARWNELLEAHPPRKDPEDAKKADPRDWEGVNSASFYPALVRESISSPPMTDERWEKLINGPAKISDAQFDRLVAAAKAANRQDDDLPFSPDDLESPRT